MEPHKDGDQTHSLSESPMETLQQSKANMEVDLKLSRWLVYFRSGPGWYPAGEYVALDAASAIDRAIQIFGCASGHRAEEIPWDAAPLPKTNAPARGRDR